MAGVTPLTGESLALQLLEALGLNTHRVLSVQLRMELGRVASIDVSYCVTVDRAGAVVKQLKRYALVELPAGAPPAAPTPPAPAEG